MFLEAAKALANNPGVAYAKAAVKKRVKFKDLPLTHQKAIMAYMIESAWQLDPKDPEDVKKAVKLYGNKPFFMGELAIDDELKKAIMSSNDFRHKTFEEWVKWYGQHDSAETKATYNEDWPVILNEPSLVPEWGLFEDGWHRFNYHYLAKNKKTLPFVQYVPGTSYFKEERVVETAFFSKHDPVNTGGRIVNRKLSGTVYHGSSTDGADGWFDTLNVDDEAAAVWVTPEESMARRFAQGRSQNKLVFVNKYKLKGLKAAELDQKAYDRISNQADFESDGRDMRYALADYLAGKRYSAWLTTGSIAGASYEDIAIFSGSESEAEYEGTSFRLKDGSWSQYEYFYDEDEAREFMRKNGLIEK